MRRSAPAPFVADVIFCHATYGATRISHRMRISHSVRGPPTERAWTSFWEIFSSAQHVYRIYFFEHINKATMATQYHHKANHTLEPTTNYHTTWPGILAGRQTLGE